MSRKAERERAFGNSDNGLRGKKMSAIPLTQDNPKGLHQRYNVTKSNGEPTDPLATYFVLRLDSHGRDGAHTEACRQAARRYALTVLANPNAAHLHRMAQDLEILVSNLEREDG